MEGYKVIIVSGLIGAGKSTVCRMLEGRGIPVYDCDSRAKALYEVYPALKAMLSPDLFSRPGALETLEDALFPLLLEDIRRWAGDTGAAVVAVESATMLYKPFFDGFGDYVLWVSAPQESRLRRVLGRGGITEESILRRMALQKDMEGSPRITATIVNDSDLLGVERALDGFLNNINFKTE